MKNSELTIEEGYKQTDVGIIAEDWEVSKVGLEFEIKLGKMLDAEKNVGTLKPLIVERGTDAVKSLPKGISENKEAVAETIENNLRKVLIDKSISNPVHFEKLSKRLDDLIEQLRNEQVSYEKYLEKIVELTKDVVDGTSGTYPSSINSNAKRALFDFLENNEELALAVDSAIITTKRANWINDKFKEKEVRIAISKVLKEFGIDDNKKVELLDLARKQSDYK